MLFRSAFLFWPQDAGDGTELALTPFSPSTSPPELICHLRRPYISDEATRVIDALRRILRPSLAASVRRLFIRSMPRRDRQPGVVPRRRALLKQVKAGPAVNNGIRTWPVGSAVGAVAVAGEKS